MPLAVTEDQPLPTLNRAHRRVLAVTAFLAVGALITAGICAGIWFMPIPVVTQELPRYQSEIYDLIGDGADSQTIDAYLSQHPEASRSLHRHGWLPLHAAVFRNRPELITVLLKYNPDINARLPNEAEVIGGYTALHVAANWADIRCITLLIEHGADPHIPIDDGYLPIDAARSRGLDDVVAYLENAMSQN